MPKNTSLQILQRWERLDAWLTFGWLRVGSFAADERVTERQVMRDLAAFREMGKRMRCERVDPKMYDICEYRWRYEPGEVPVFSSNIGRKVAPRY